MKMFAPKGKIFFWLVIAAVLTLSKDHQSLGDKYTSWQLLIVDITTLIVLGLIFWLCISNGKRTELKKKHRRELEDIIKIALRDNKPDEVIKILENNVDKLPDILETDGLDAVFSNKLIASMLKSRSYLHLELLANEKISKAIYQPLEKVKFIVRELLADKNSVLYHLVASTEGTDGSVEWHGLDIFYEGFFDNMELCQRLFITKAISDVVVEYIESGDYDNSYNNYDRLYSPNSSFHKRCQCPIFVGYKCVVFIVKNAIRQNVDSDDYYTESIGYIYRAVLKHSKYDTVVWEKCDDREYPTPYVVLMKEILSDIETLVKDVCRSSLRTESTIAKRLAQS